VVILLSNDNCNLWRWPLTHILVSLHHQNSIKKYLQKARCLSRQISAKGNLHYLINLEIQYLAKLRLTNTIPANIRKMMKKLKLPVTIYYNLAESWNTWGNKENAITYVPKCGMFWKANILEQR
jgi:hypothetical protein